MRTHHHHWFRLPPLLDYLKRAPVRPALPAGITEQVPSNFAVRLFYAAPLALSLMLGKYCLASTPVVPPPPLPDPALMQSADAPAMREFAAARNAFERRDLKGLAASRNAFRSTYREFPLAAYVDYWWLLANLGQGNNFAVSNAAEFNAFLVAQPDAVLSDSLRKEWLRALGRLDQWELFRNEFQRINIDDADLTCHHWRYRIGQNDGSALTEAKSFWISARSASDNCYGVFEQLRDAQMISAEIAWPRVRRLLEENQLADARRSAALIEKLPANFERNTASAGINPAAFLEKEKLNARSRASVELFLFAINRVARGEAGKAAALMETRGKELNAADRGYAWAQIGFFGAMQHDPNALGWFEKAGPVALNDTQAGWKARAALRAADWPTLRKAIDAMSALEKRDPAWRYWQARADAALGNEPGAARIREGLARENNFYGLLAAEESGQMPTPNWKGWRPSPVDLAVIQQRPAVVRALLLYRLDMRSEGLKEWQFAIRNMNDQELLAAAEVARSANVPDRAISTADRTIMLHDFSQRFPMPFRTDLQAQAKVQGLDEAWVYGLIRQESRFIADAKSRVGASGLMQLMPATAKWAAKQVGMASYSPARVTDVPVNLALGSFYLKHVLDDLGHPILATAAYNAGPGRARRWRADQALEGAVYAESIPFNETRDYVKKVMTNAWFYANQAGIGQPSFKNMVGTVPGKIDNRRGISSLVSAMAPAGSSSLPPAAVATPPVTE